MNTGVVEEFEKNDTELVEPGAMERLGNGNSKVADDGCGVPRAAWMRHALAGWRAWKARIPNKAEEAARARWQEYLAAKRAAAKKAPVKRSGKWLTASGPWRGFLTSAKQVLFIHSCSKNRVRQAAAVGKSRNKRCPKCGTVLPEATEMLYTLQKLR